MPLLLLLACTTAGSADPEPAPPIDPLHLYGKPLSFAPWFGAPIALPAGPGEYSASVDVRFHKFITMERDVGWSVRGESSLSLSPDGAASGCLQGVRSSRSSVSEYASDDGQRHVYENEDRFQIAFRGVWEAPGGWMRVWVQGTAWDTCEPPEPNGYDHNDLLLCAILPAGQIPGEPPAERPELLACRLIGGSLMSGFQHLSLPIGAPFDDAEARMPGSEPPGERWLLLGAAPGVEISWSDVDALRQPVARFEVREAAEGS